MPVMSKLQRAKMAKEYASGSSLAELSRAYGVSDDTVRAHCYPKKPTAKEFTPNRVESEGRKQTYRENINWALGAAGEYLRTKARPKMCPNDSAWFLYCCAIEEPKDFLAKVSAVEKSAEEVGGSEIKKSTRKSLVEIETFLEMLDGEEEESETTDGNSDTMRPLQDSAPSVVCSD